MIEKDTIRNIDDRAIIGQVEKICNCAEFKSKELLCRFLSYIVSEYLAGREDNIKGYNIGVDVFNRGEDFDPGQDALVRIHAGRLRRMLDFYYLKEGKNDPVRIEIPKGAYTPRFRFIKRQTEPEEKKGFNTGDQNVSLTPRVAIFPFKNLTGNPEKDYFAQGFSEELSVELTKYEDLIVFNPLQFLSVSAEEFHIKKILQDKRVRFIIEGAVNKSRDKVKILVRLTDLDENKQLWAERYTETLTADNLIEVQERIAKEVSGIVGSEYGIILHKISMDAQRIRPQKLDTYRAILKFYYFQAHHTSEAATEAFQALTQALDQDPNSGVATALLATMHGNRYMLDLPQADGSYVMLGKLAERAIKIDPHSLTVNVALAFKHFVYNEKERFFGIAEKCLAMNPVTSLRLGALAFHISLFGDWERGYKILHELMQTHIGYPLYFHGSTMLYFYRKKEYKSALVEANKYMIPAIFWGPMLRAAVLGQLGRKNEASPEIALLMKLKADFEQKASYLISRYVKEKDLLEHVLEGLRKAGMQLKPGT